MTFFDNTQLSSLWPEIILALGAFATLSISLFASDGRAIRVARLGCWITLAAALVSLYQLAPLAANIFDGAATLDRLAVMSKTLILVGAGLCLYIGRDYWQREKLERYEIYILALFSLIGMCLMVSSAHLLTIYMAIEVQSLAIYVLAAFNRDSLRSSEAGLKYFVLGALSSGMLLYGMSLVYGFSGTLHFDGITEAVAAGSNPGLVTGIILIFCGLAFKISAAPFHMWTPDVYEGAPSPVTLFLATAPKIAGVVLLARFFLEAVPAGSEFAVLTVALIASASMLIGAIGALVQTNLKRLLAYSSIGHMGYAISGLLNPTAEGLASVLVYITIYLISAIAAFSMLFLMRRQEGMVENIDDLSGLVHQRPGITLAFSMVLFSLAGLPPFVGFIAKVQILSSIAQAQLWWVMIILVLSSAIAAFYYLRLVYIMTMRDSDGEFRPPDFAARAALILGAITLFPILLVGIAWVQRWAGIAAQSLF